MGKLRVCVSVSQTIALLMPAKGQEEVEMCLMLVDSTFYFKGDWRGVSQRVLQLGLGLGLGLCW